MDLKLIKQEIKKDQVCPSCHTKMDLSNYIFSLQSGMCIGCDHVMADVREGQKNDK